MREKYLGKFDGHKSPQRDLEGPQSSPRRENTVRHVQVLKETPSENALGHHSSCFSKEELSEAPSWATWLGESSFLGNPLEEGRDHTDLAHSTGSVVPHWGREGLDPRLKQAPSFQM